MKKHFLLRDLTRKQLLTRMIVWFLVLAVSLLFSYMTFLSCSDIKPDLRDVYLRPWGDSFIALKPGQTLRQEFEASATGSAQTICLDLANGKSDSTAFSLRFISLQDGSVMANYQTNPEDFMFQKDAAEDRLHYSHWITFPFVLDFHSHAGYMIEVTNLDPENPLKLGYNPAINSGNLTVEETERGGFLNVYLSLNSSYQPSLRLVVCLIAIALLTVMAGITLVLFTNFKVQNLYLILAIGFGFVTLFDLTPLYGFDMYFHFDSAYVVSNRILGIDGEQRLQSKNDPDRDALYYQRRICDDNSDFQFYYDTNVSRNYQDNRYGLRQWTADPEDQELQLVETSQFDIGGQLYLYIPQALGFALARLLGWGMFPMILLARVFAYGLFVLAMYRGISRIPFGKYIMLILGLSPSILVQSVSITRDVVIFIMAAYLISKVLSTAYSDRQPTFWDWIGILTISVLLAPCKMIYLPLSFFWLLIIYRKNIMEQKQPWYKIVFKILLYSLPILVFFIFTNVSSIQTLTETEKIGLQKSPSRTLSVILEDPSYAIFIFLNTIRTELGNYFLNALELYEIDLGATHTVSLVFTVLLCLASCESSEKIRQVRPIERFFFFLVSLGVFLLTALAAMQWTPIRYDVILGLQGRYLIPILPLVFLIPANNKVIQVHEDLHGRVIGFMCSIIPALFLMNMFIWTAAT